VNRSERHLQTDHSQGPEYLCRDHDGLEGPLMSSAPGCNAEGSRSPMPESDPSISRIDPEETLDYVSLNDRNAVHCGPTIEPVGRHA
jgi:hypothetical protein